MAEPNALDSELNTKVTFVEAHSCFLFSAKYFRQGRLNRFHSGPGIGRRDDPGRSIYVSLRYKHQFVKSEDSATSEQSCQTSVYASTLTVLPDRPTVWIFVFFIIGLCGLSFFLY